jgi:DNA modification methylase
MTTKLCDTVEPNQLIVEDCRTALPRMPDGIADLLVTDPPFNIGLDYDGYDDNKPSEQYLDMLRDVVTQARRVLKPEGSLFMFMGQLYQAPVYKIIEDAGFHWRNSIVWHYTFGPNQRKKFTPSWTMIHYFSCDPHRFTFNADVVRVPSARQLLYNDRRAKSGGKVPDDTWVLLPSESPRHFGPDQDAWLVSRVCGTFKERAGHTTQLPLALVERIIRVASNAGDLVLDPFAGSGTVPLAARGLGRRYLGIEISEHTAELARRRLAGGASAGDATGPVPGDQTGDNPAGAT